MKYNRLQQIKQLLVQQNRVTTAELSERFHVSIETVRRDLDLLEAEGFIRKIYGGAEICGESCSAKVMDEWANRCKVSVTEKQAIAEKALGLIPDGCTVALDSGTTTYKLGCLLGEKKGLTILTNSLHCAMAVSCHADHRVFLIGGQIKKGEMISTGILACDFLDCFSKIDVAVIGVDGFTLEDGVMDYSLDMCLIKRKFLKKSRMVIALADHTKFGVQANYNSCSLEQLDYLITDTKTDRKMLEEIFRQGIKVMLAKGHGGAGRA